MLLCHSFERGLFFPFVKAQHLCKMAYREFWRHMQIFKDIILVITQSRTTLLMEQDESEIIYADGQE